MRIVVIGIVVWVAGQASAQEVPSFARNVRPVLAKYCLECHNPKALKGGLDLESFKGILEGGDKGEVLFPGDPDKSRLVTLTEGKEKPFMPPKTAKHHPKKEEIALLRAWVKAGAKDDSSLIKVALPEIKPRRDAGAPVSALAFDPLSRFLAMGRLGTVEFHALGKETRGPEISPDKVTGLAYSRDGNLLARAHGIPGAAGYVHLHQGMKGPGAAKLLPHQDVILDLAISPNGKWLASSSYDTQVRLLFIAEDKSPPLPVLLKDHSDGVYGLAYSPDSTRIATASADRTVKVWEVGTGRLLLTLGEANDWLYSVAWSADGTYLAAGGLDRSIRLYRMNAGKAQLLHSVFAHEGGVLKVLFSNDGKKLYSLGQEGVVKVWKTAVMQELRTFERQPENVQVMAVSPDHTQIALGRYDGVVVLLEEATGKVLAQIKPMPPAKKAAPPKEKPAADPFPAQKETGDNSSPGKGMMITLPASIHGGLDRAGDCDFYRFSAKKGQQIGVQAITAAMGSKVDPYLQLTDLRGNLLAESNDGLLAHTFAEDGTFALGLRDRELKGGPGLSYRLHLGPIPVARSIYPLGIGKGEEREFIIGGVFLDQPRLTFKAPTDAVPGTRLNLPITSKLGKVLGSTQVVVGEFPEAVSDAKTNGPRGNLTFPGTGNGVLGKPGASDSWRFPAKKGDRVVVEIEARRLGSPLDSVIEILDASGKPVERAVLRCQAKTFVTFRDHDNVQGNIRIEAWNDLTVNDYIYVGSELLKIQALPTHPDADCNFFTAGGMRTGFLDTTPTHQANNEPMYKVSLHPPGTTFPPNGYPVFTLFYRNDDGGPGYGRDSRLFFDPPADGEYQVRVSDARGTGGAAFVYRLTVRPPRPSFTLRFSPEAPAVGRGGAIPVAVTADRLDGYAGPIQVRLENLPPGFHAPATDIPAGLNATAVALFAEEKATLPAKPLPLKVIGEALIDGKKVIKETVGKSPTLIDPGEIVTRTVESEIALKPGGITTLTVLIERRGKFAGRIPLEVRGLPHGVRVLDIGLNGILITESETRRTIQIYAEPWVEATDHPIVVLAKREGKNTEHGAKSVLLKIGR